jgi:inosine/xanthosine triphosphatase
MKIAIGTISELKISALKNALEKLNIEAEIVSAKTDSGISNQPFGYEETTKGAKNRAKEALEKTGSNLAMGVESGLIKIEGNYFDIACIYMVSKEGDESVSYSSGYFTPQWIIDEIKEKDIEYGIITQRLSNDPDKDPIKYFSGGKIKREKLLSQAITIALVQMFNKDKYQKP